MYSLYLPHVYCSFGPSFPKHSNFVLFLLYMIILYQINKLKVKLVIAVSFEAGKVHSASEISTKRIKVI